MARRLDRFLISKILQSRVSSCEILSSLLSDHLPIYIAIDTEEGDYKKATNYWKFNKLLLEDNIFAMGLRKLIAEKRIEYADLDKQIKWELVKFDIRTYSIEYSKKNCKGKIKSFKRK